MPLYTGTASSDSLVGGAGNDTLSGLAGRDTLEGWGGNDHLDGGADNDTLVGGLGDDTFTGGGGFDFLRYAHFTTSVTITVATTAGTATAGNSVVKSGGLGTDVFSDIDAFGGSQAADLLQFTGTAVSGTGVYLQGFQGADTIKGGGGYNVYADYFADTAGVAVDLGAGTGAAHGTVDTLVDVRGVRGGQGNDTLTGDAFDNRFLALAGNDTVDGGAGFDTVMTAGMGTLSLSWSAPGAGVATIALFGGGTSRIAFTHIERVVGGAGRDTLGGSAGDDWLAPAEGADAVDGGAGYDYVDYSFSGAALTAGVTVNLAAGRAVDWSGATDTLVGIEAAQGTQLADDLTAAAVTDGVSRSMLRGMGGNDTLRGAGDLIATADYNNTPGAVTVDLRDAADMFALDGHGGRDRLVGIRSVRGSDLDDLLYGSDAGVRLDGNDGNDGIAGGTGADRLQGGAGNDRLLGGAGADTLEGGTGADTLLGGAGNDTLDGGDGTDWLDLSEASGAAAVKLGREGLQTLVADQGRDTVLNVENVLGGGFADNLAGSAGANALLGAGGNDRLFGLEGADTLQGGEGQDSLDGGAGADSLQGGAGDDTYVVDEAGDVVSEAGAGGADAGGLDLVKASIAFTLGAFLENLTLTGTAGLTGTGNALANRLAGNDGANRLSALDGDDLLLGGRGADTLLGGEGDDTILGMDAGDVIDGGAGLDTLDLSKSGSRAWIYLDGTDEKGVARANAYAAAGVGLTAVENVTGSAGGHDALWGDSGANRLNGLAGNDRLHGKGGADRLEGGEGADTLSGGAGADDLIGGTGADWFLFDAAPLAGTVDRILDFEAGVDKLVVSRAAFGLGAGVTPAIEIEAAVAANAAGPTLLYDNAGGGIGGLFYDADGAGGGAAIQIARLSNGAALAAGDFLFTA